MDEMRPLTPQELAIQQQAIDRQRKIAEYLQQQSLTPEQGQMVSGHYVAPSMTQYLSKLAQGFIGSQKQAALDKQAASNALSQGDIIGRQFDFNRATPQTTVVSDAQAPIDNKLAQIASKLQEIGRASCRERV